MFETEKNPQAVQFADDIRIVGLNTDKTRKMIGSETVYQVYFELSGSPPQGWRTIFEDEWKKLNAGQALSLQDTSVERAFLMMHCPINEVASQLPVLKKAVAAANIAYRSYVLRQASDLKAREDVWKDERKNVEDIAKSLQFD